MMWMNQGIFSAACILGCAATTAFGVSAPELELSSGKLVFDASGAASYRSEQGEISLSVGYYAPGWSKRSQWKLAADASSLEEKGDQHWAWKNTFKQGEAKADLYQEVQVAENGDVTITYRLEKTEGFDFESGSKGPHMEAVMPSASSSGETIYLAGESVTLPANNVWNYGDNVIFSSWGLDITSGQRLSLSVWKVGGGDGGSSVRFPLKETESSGGGVTVYEGRFVLN